MTSHDNPDRRSGAPSGITGRQILIAILVVLSLWFIFANTGSVKIRFWIPTVEAPLWTVLAGTFIVGYAVGWLVRSRRARRA